jgi:hypothetical protein
MQRPTLINVVTYVAKILARILSRGSAEKIEDLLWKDQFGFIKEKENTDETVMLRIILKGRRAQLKNCVLSYRMAEGIWPCKLDKINADPEG